MPKAKVTTGDSRRGRPLKFKTVAELKKKVEAYFRNCNNRKRKVVLKTCLIVYTADPGIYTITGLALALGTNRETLLNYEKRDDFFDTVKNAKERVHNYVEESLFTPRIATGVIFNLKNNFGREDRQVLGGDENAPLFPPIEIVLPKKNKKGK